MKKQREKYRRRLVREKDERICVRGGEKTKGKGKINQSRKTSRRQTKVEAQRKKIRWTEAMNRSELKRQS